jgi:hypothetical protein
VHDALVIPNEALGEKYLGLPTAVGCASDGTFDYVPERIRSFVHGWGGKLLSCVGREVLLKSNAQAVPTYPMSCFRLSVPTCKKMKQYISKFWWGCSIEFHKIHRQRWCRLTRSKGEGGMGFRDMSLFNQAMLGKQGWHLIMRSDSLCAKLLKGKYFSSCSFLEASRKKKCSKTWKAILFGRQALIKGLTKRVGPGDTINIWSDNWISGTASMKPIVRLPDAQPEKVSDLFLPGSRQWDVQLVEDTFCTRDAEEILKIRPGVRITEDVLTWALEKSSVYSVRSCYRLLKTESAELESLKLGETTSSDEFRWWQKIWKLQVPPKIRIFWW